MGRDDFLVTGHKPVGRGAFGTVFAATRVADGQKVAFKLVLHSGEWGPERIEAERKGAILQQRFAHTHGMVPAVYDFGADGDDFYIAMEFVEGTSLDLLLRNGRLAPAEAAAHAAWVCEFLEKAHAFCGVVDGKSYRIVHTDLKPAHLMIGPDGDRRVLDFGIAKALEESRELGTDIARTIAYAAPERLVSDQVNPHADFWSLGVMLYEMVCGHRPYPHLEGPRFRRELEHAIASNAPRAPLPESCPPTLEGPRFRRELEHAIASNAPRAPLPESCPPTLGAIVTKLLAFQVEHRYPTAAAIKADLDRFLRGEVPEALPIYETPATTPVQRIAAGGVAVAETSKRTWPRPLPVALPDVDPSPATTPRAMEIPPTAPRVLAAPKPSTAEAAAEPGNQPPAEAATRKPTMRRRVLAAAALLFAMVITVTEGVACVFAERFRDTMAAIDERTVIERRRAYEAVDRAGLLDFGLHTRVHARLFPALVAIGDRVIADYRREEPAMGPAEWAQAHTAVTWAIELSRPSRELRARQLTAAGHVKRFEAQTAKGGAATLRAQESLALFQKAAEADPESYDPYLGMARLQVYSLNDLDSAEDAIREAEKRGYVRGRREAALLGDGYLRRASASWKRARVLTGEQRTRELTTARSDYNRCIELFDPIIAFGNSASNLEICKAQVERIDRLLEPDVDIDGS